MSKRVGAELPVTGVTVVPVPSVAGTIVWACVWADAK